MKKRHGIGDIARIAGVSKGAVSFALNGRPGVSEETRQRIIKVADELKWRPHSAARSLGGHQTDVMGMVIARAPRTISLEPFFMQMISGIQSVLSPRGIGVQMQVAASVEEEVEIYRRWWTEQRVDGIIMFDPRKDDPRYDVIDELALNAVVVSSDAKRGRYSVVWADDAAAMGSAVDYLYECGHRHIAHVHGPEDFLHTRLRMAAAIAAQLRLEGLSTTAIETDFTDLAGANATKELMARTRRPSAIIYDSDVLSFAGLRALKQLGVRIPEDIAILSFDDSLLTELTQPAITALSRDTFDFGAQVGNAVLEKYENPQHHFALQCPTPHLVVRESTVHGV